MFKIYLDTAERYEKKIKITDMADTVIFEESGDLDITSILAKKSTAEIYAIYFADRAGSFTGIKIGVTITNILNWALGKKPASDQIIPSYGKEPNIQQPLSNDIIRS